MGDLIYAFKSIFYQTVNTWTTPLHKKAETLAVRVVLWVTEIHSTSITYKNTKNVDSNTVFLFAIRAVLFVTLRITAAYESLKIFLSLSVHYHSTSIDKMELYWEMAINEKGKGERGRFPTTEIHLI